MIVASAYCVLDILASNQSYALVAKDCLKTLLEFCFEIRDETTIH